MSGEDVDVIPVTQSAYMQVEVNMYQHVVYMLCYAEKQVAVPARQVGQDSGIAQQPAKVGCPM